MAYEAHAKQKKWHYEDNDPDQVSEAPPTLNLWYELFDEEDQRLIFHHIKQANDEVAAKTCEMRWTIDGTVYLRAQSLASGQDYFIYKTEAVSGAGAPIYASTTTVNAGYHTDKRGLSFKVEVRITEALGTNQTLISHTVREKLVET